MRKKFMGYFKRTNEEFNELWDNAIFVLDTNVLLDLYRYSKDTTEDILKVLDTIQDRLWIPYHVCTEFFNDRIKAIEDENGSYEKFKSTIVKNIDEITKTIKTKRHPHVKDVDELLPEFEKLQKKLINKLNEAKSDLIDVQNDPILDKVAILFEDRVGDELTETEISKIEVEGKGRYEKSIPPGYKDKNKDHNKFGDLIIWKGILDKLKDVPIIFVTSDQKDDWWLRNNKGQTISPRPELIQECAKYSENAFYMYSLDQFLKYMKEKNPSAITDETISEVDEKEYLGELVSRQREWIASKETNYWDILDAPLRALDAIYPPALLETLDKQQSIVDAIQHLPPSYMVEALLNQYKQPDILKNYSEIEALKSLEVHRKKALDDYNYLLWGTGTNVNELFTNFDERDLSRELLNNELMHLNEIAVDNNSYPRVIKIFNNYYRFYSVDEVSELIDRIKAHPNF